MPKVTLKVRARVTKATSARATESNAERIPCTRQMVTRAQHRKASFGPGIKALNQIDPRYENLQSLTRWLETAPVGDPQPGFFPQPEAIRHPMTMPRYASKIRYTPSQTLKLRNGDKVSELKVKARFQTLDQARQHDLHLATLNRLIFDHKKARNQKTVRDGKTKELGGASKELIELPRQ